MRKMGCVVGLHVLSQDNLLIDAGAYLLRVAENEAGVDLMLNGHLHRHIHHEPGQDGCQFPTLVNSNEHRVVKVVSKQGIRLTAYNAEGEEFF